MVSTISIVKMKKLIEETDRLNRFEAELAEQAAKSEEQATKLKEQEEELAVHSAQIESLTESSQGYLDIRHRFLEVFCRDVKQEKLESSAHHRIFVGNKAAHHGDAVTDAYLYTSGARTDQGTMEAIYGVTPALIDMLSKWQKLFLRIIEADALQIMVVRMILSVL